MAEHVPRLMAGVDIRKFKLDPMDGFLMTRIDGKLTPKDLARETGLPDFSVVRALEKLVKMGVLEMIDPSAPPPPPPPPVQPKSAIAQFDGGLLAPKYDPKELEEEAELTPEQKKRVLDFYYRLDDLDHYTLLGSNKEADKKAIKRAYFELAATFHPDRYFKKELGSFKPKMEALFNRITEAHDTLVDAAKRAEYDAYLAEVATTRGMEAMLERAMAESARAAEAAAAAAPHSQPQPHHTQPPAHITVPPVSAAPVSTGPSAEELAARRAALARKLTGGKASPASAPKPTVTTPPNPLRYASSADAVEALKRRYEERVENATMAHAAKYVQAADDAMAKNDIVSAATALSIAIKFAPDDVVLATRAAETRTAADTLLGDSYLKQAQYEERQGHWEEASKSWLKVAKIKNTSNAHERAANALLRSPDSDLREAAEHAKQAITLEPSVMDGHITLIEIYIKAGLIASARKATEAALTLDPKHIGVQTLLKRIGKG